MELTAAAGIAAPSFYAAFGSKEAAFREAVDHYTATVGAVPMQRLDRAPSLREGLRAMLIGSIDVALSRRPGGCLLVLGVVNYLPDNEPARQCLMDKRRMTRELIAARIERGRMDGELGADTDTKQLAAFVHGVMQMISFQARDGAYRQELTLLIEPTLKACEWSGSCTPLHP